MKLTKNLNVQISSTVCSIPLSDLNHVIFMSEDYIVKRRRNKNSSLPTPQSTQVNDEERRRKVSTTFVTIESAGSTSNQASSSGLRSL